NKMVNAGKMAAEFIGKFPETESPEHTEGYDGFYHLIAVNGDVEKAHVHYIIRDFDKENFAARKQAVQAFAEELKAKYGDDAIELDKHNHVCNVHNKDETI